MSLRIQNDNLAGLALPGAGRTDEISQPSGSSNPASARSGQPSADSVDISSLSQNVAAASNAQAAQQAGRVKQLAALYQSGQYSVDSASVSRAIVSQALQSAPGENS